jgi:hypothetical protein
MSIDGVKSKRKAQASNPNQLNPELAKNLPGSPKSLEAAKRIKQSEGKKTHVEPEKQEKKSAADPKELDGNTIPSSRFPTGAFD